MKARAFAALALACSIAAAFAGCATPRPEGERVAETVRGEAPPAYAEVARRYNERVAPIRSLYSAGTVRLTYFDADGNRRQEQGDATVQVILPDRLALSLRKAGKRLFWLGGNQERYWWFDLVEARQAVVGRHETFEREARERIGLAIHPLDMIRVLGILELPEDVDAGATQWSADGLLGVTTRIRDGGYQRLWMDPQRLEPQKIELFDANQQLAVVADLEMYDYMPITGIGGLGPRMARRLSVLDVASGTDVRLTMDAPEGGERRISQGAFDFEALRRTLGVERIVDVDQPRAMGAAAGRGGE